VPSVLLTAYGDTLYGYRCYNIYVTADSGARTGVPGLIANCVWKKYLDTGTNGNSIAATNTNTTALDPFGLTIPLPGCNSIPKAPSGIDGPPCVPKAEDDEFTATFGFADAADPAFAGVNLGTSTATLTNGELIFSPQNVNAQDQARLLCMPTYPTTPYTFVATVSIVNGGVSSFGGIGVTDGTKLLSLTSGSSAITVGHWTNINNNFSSAPVNITIPHDQGLWTYLKLQDTGTNIVYSHSFDGINYYQDLSEGRTSFLTPAKFCLEGEGASTFYPADFLRLPAENAVRVVNSFLHLAVNLLFVALMLCAMGQSADAGQLAERGGWRDRQHHWLYRPRQDCMAGEHRHQRHASPVHEYPTGRRAVRNGGHAGEYLDMHHTNPDARP
jgi:hypothetical protein